MKLQNKRLLSAILAVSMIWNTGTFSAFSAEEAPMDSEKMLDWDIASAPDADREDQEKDPEAGDQEKDPAKETETMDPAGESGTKAPGEEGEGAGPEEEIRTEDPAGESPAEESQEELEKKDLEEDLEAGQRTGFVFHYQVDMSQLVSDFPDPEELFAGYVDQVFYGSDQGTLYGNHGEDRLEGTYRLMYDRFKDCVKKVAAGGRL